MSFNLQIRLYTNKFLKKSRNIPNLKIIMRRGGPRVLPLITPGGQKSAPTICEKLVYKKTESGISRIPLMLNAI